MPRMRSDCVKRRALKLFVFLLAGATVNVAVAWGCAYWTADLKRGADQVRGMSIRANRWWEVNRWTRPTSTFVWWFVMPFADSDVVKDPSPLDVIPWWSTLPRSTQHLSDEELGSPFAHRAHLIGAHQAAWG